MTKITDKLLNDLVGLPVLNEKSGAIQSLYKGKAPRGKPCDKFKWKGEYVPNRICHFVLDHIETDSYIHCHQCPELAVALKERDAGCVEMSSDLYDPHLETIAAMLEYPYQVGFQPEECADYILGDVDRNIQESLDFITTDIRTYRNKVGKTVWLIKCVCLETGGRYYTYVDPVNKNVKDWEELIQNPSHEFVFKQDRRLESNPRILNADNGPTIKTPAIDK